MQCAVTPPLLNTSYAIVLKDVEIRRKIHSLIVSESSNNRILSDSRLLGEHISHCPLGPLLLEHIVGGGVSDVELARLNSFRFARTK